MLYLVPTPIGNLRDMTYRAVDVLKEADVIVCEDTRQTPKLLQAYGIEKKPLLSFHEHSAPGRIQEILEFLKENKKVAMVTDGGTPLISDPGFEVVREAIHKGFSIESLPGPCALTTALAGSGLAVDQFSFFGFLPQKSTARETLLKSLTDRAETLIFFESPFRLVKALTQIKEIFGDREAAVARELTKKFEEYTRGKLSDLIRRFTTKKPQGEIVILVSGKGRKPLYRTPSGTGPV